MPELTRRTFPPEVATASVLLPTGVCFTTGGILWQVVGFAMLLVVPGLIWAGVKHES